MIFAAALGPAAALADCPSATTTEELHTAIREAEDAFAKLDENRFNVARDVARGTLLCVGEDLTPGDAASYHYLMALGAFFDGDADGTVAACRALVELIPAYELPADIAPQGHPLRADLATARTLGTSARYSLPNPAEGYIYVDGHRAGSAPQGRPYVFQRMDRTGNEVYQTEYVRTGEPAPLYERFVAFEPGPAGGGPSVSVPLLGGAAGAALVGGGLFTLSRAKLKAIDDPATQRGTRDDLRNQASNLTWAAAGMGFVATGLGVSAFFVVAW